jgi:tetratricopeptide (TPR) repeat protein
VGVDRETAVKKADDLAREGKLDLAIEEYRRVVDDQPGDLGAANALGDLYAKIGDKKQAVAQFVRIGDSHRDSGFIPKAVAFYKKALKVDPASDQALSQLAQIAIDQELYADATLYLNRLLQQRREQGHEAGIAECVVRLASLPTANADAKVAAARAAAGHYPPVQAAQMWVEAADALERAGRPGEALDVLFEASALAAGDVTLHRRIAQACAQTGQIDRAGTLLSLETAGDHPELLLALAKRAIRDGRDEEARRALRRTIDVAPDRRVEAEALLAPLTPVTPPAPVAAEPDDSGGDERVEISFDEAAPMAEAVPPASTSIVEPTRLTAALPAEPLSASEAAMTSEPEMVLPLDAPAPSMDVTPEPVAGDVPAQTTASELEWSAVVLDAAGGDEAESHDDSPTVETAAPAVDETPAAEPVGSSADADAIAALTAAAENPALQFQASAQIGRLLLRQRRLGEAIAWFERAALATTSAREQRLDVMYELADALERHGNQARALDVFADLDLDAASYRDVPDRMARLRRALDEGRAT